MLINVDKQKTDTVICISEAYIRLCFHRKKTKEISKHACTCTCACMCPLPTAAQPHLKGVRVCTTCASVCAATISLIHPLCLSVCTCTSVVCPDACIYNAEVLSMCNKHLTLGQTAVIYTHTYTHSHTFNTFTQAQYPVNIHEKHEHSLKR
jgi:hypothetical protein